MNKTLFLNALNTAIAEKNHTQKDVENATGISQSQISKILNGDFLRKGEAVEGLMKYSNYNEYSESKLVSKIINKAIAEVWDGSSKMEKQIARIIREIGKTWEG